MIAYKFLRAGRVAPFSGRVWPEPKGEWVEAAGGLSVCSQGIHACRPMHLPYWVAKELWRIDLDGDLVEHPLKVVAPRGRLVERVAAWDESAARRFAVRCLGRTAYHAAAELRSAGLEAEAESVERTASGTPKELAAAAAKAASVAAEGRRPARHAGHLAEYVADSVGWLDDPAATAYVAAHAADSRTSPDGDGDPFVRERELQAQWLQEALGLED